MTSVLEFNSDANVPLNTNDLEIVNSSCIEKFQPILVSASVFSDIFKQAFGSSFEDTQEFQTTDSHDFSLRVDSDTLEENSSTEKEVTGDRQELEEVDDDCLVTGIENARYETLERDISDTKIYNAPQFKPGENKAAKSFLKKPKASLRTPEFLKDPGKPTGKQNNHSTFPIREDIIIQYCRHSPRGICDEFVSLKVDYSRPLVPWYCSRHRLIETTPNLNELEDIKPGLKDIFLNKYRDYISASNEHSQKSKTRHFSENNSPKTKNTPPTKSNKNKLSGLKNSIWSQENAKQFTPRQNSEFSSLKEEMTSITRFPGPARTNNRYAQPANLKVESSESPNGLNVPIFTPYRSVPKAIWDNDSPGGIKIYSVRIPDGTNFLQFYKIGKEINVDSLELKSCSIMDHLKGDAIQQNVTLLSELSSPHSKLLSWYIHCELKDNHFNTFTSFKAHCDFCKSSHEEWYSLTEENFALLSKKVEVAHSQHQGWPYIQLLVKQLDEFITKTYPS